MDDRMKHDNCQTLPRRKTAALLDGLITMAGLGVAVGGFFRSEIAMWWLGV